MFEKSHIRKKYYHQEPSTHHHVPINSSPIIKACAKPSGLGCSL
jgi:hypothetical protein